MKPVVDKYLARFAEPEARAPYPSVEAAWGIAIPACGEGAALVDALATAPTSALVVVVINEPKGASASVRRRNQESLDAIDRRYGPPEHRRSPLVLTRTREAALDRKHGVGLARKIGADVLLALWRRRQLAHPVVGLTDADVRLPESYLAGLRQLLTAGAVAGWHPFVHLARDEEERGWEPLATAYEVYLRHYVLGLRQAGSPYAFPTIGSTVALHLNAYALVRGVPTRAAGEDFYLLNKLRKVGDVVPLSGDPVQLSPRPSDRVPFGTGAFLRRSASLSPEAISLTHPRAFDALGALLAAHQRTALSPTPADEASLDAALAAELERQGIPRTVAAILLTDRHRRLVRDAIARGTHPASRQRHLLAAFDGLRTLKALHALRDQVFPSLPLREALRSSPFIDPELADLPLPDLRGALARADDETHR